jgi:hypothetical protein
MPIFVCKLSISKAKRGFRIVVSSFGWLRRVRILNGPMHFLTVLLGLDTQEVA